MVPRNRSEKQRKGGEGMKQNWAFSREIAPSGGLEQIENQNGGELKRIPGKKRDVRQPVGSLEKRGGPLRAGKTWKKKKTRRKKHSET